MISQGHVTRASLKQANKEYKQGHLLSACIYASILETSLNKLRYPEQYDVKVWSLSDKQAQSYNQKLWCKRMLVLH